MMNRAAQERAYKAQMAALTEENRVMQLPREQLLQRQREIHRDCFGEPR